jgi:hypothetical protein
MIRPARNQQSEQRRRGDGWDTHHKSQILVPLVSSTSTQNGSCFDSSTKKKNRKKFCGVVVHLHFFPNAYNT